MQNSSRTIFNEQMENESAAVLYASYCEYSVIKIEPASYTVIPLDLQLRL
jgi:hypothetical protein